MNHVRVFLHVINPQYVIEEAISRHTAHRLHRRARNKPFLSRVSGIHSITEWRKGNPWKIPQLNRFAQDHKFTFRAKIENQFFLQYQLWAIKWLGDRYDEIETSSFCEKPARISTEIENLILIHRIGSSEKRDCACWDLTHVFSKSKVSQKFVSEADYGFVLRYYRESDLTHPMRISRSEPRHINIMFCLLYASIQKEYSKSRIFHKYKEIFRFGSAVTFCFRAEFLVRSVHEIGE
jgi:hypothetical protein